ncbi:multicopper oxidase domain-containing protein [Rhodohalobacter halophilus]|uniref:multicopper oxidase domain-containing protein n=1 Tax=Rhodohalobacter halophilus TaxID=1812810 RepID=UPI00083FCBDD|nr:multicopper oxidase domain-containing protein [Rhodohalobacter halophilus]
MKFFKNISIITFILFFIAGLMNLQAQTQEYKIDGMTFGMPEAKVYTDDYDGPPVVGEYVTMLPKLAKLDYEGNKHHHVRLDTFTQEIEVASGVRYRAWTFGGMVPGPVIHVKEGDRITFTMKNRSDEMVEITQPIAEMMQQSEGQGGPSANLEVQASVNGSESADPSPYLRQIRENNYMGTKSAIMPMPHSMDFHSGTVAKDDKWRTIAPGETIEFDWVANYPGTYIYHCGTPSVLMHTAMGQHGVVVVSPKDGYETDEKVDEEYVVVQSEYYLKKGSGDLYQYDFDAAQNKRPSHVVFNGHQTILHDQPLTANAGERVRIHFSNNGPSLTSSFHVIGGIFDRVWMEGHPFNEMRGMQTVLLGASNSATIEFIVPEEGKYILIDHEFADAEKGATGTLVAGPKK